MSPACRRTGDAAFGIAEAPLWTKNPVIVAECYNTAKFRKLLRYFPLRKKAQKGDGGIFNS
jgi:hypothetical protein